MMIASITQKDAVYLIALQNDSYKEIFVVDELYLNNSKINSNDFDLAEWIAKEVNP